MNQQTMPAVSSATRKTATRITAVVLVVLALVIAINALVGALPYRYRVFNLAKLNEFQLSAKSKEWLEGLDEDITLYLVCSGGETQANRDLVGFLKEYASASDRISYRVVDPRAEEDLIDAFGGVWPEDNSIIVSSRHRWRILENGELYYYYNTQMDVKMSLAEFEEQAAYLLEADTTGQLATLFAETTEAKFDGESWITNSIDFVTWEIAPTAYVLTGSNTVTLDSDLKNLLLITGFELRTLSSFSSIPEDCDLIVINGPANDLGATEAETLADYLSKGGKLFLTTLYLKNQDLPNLYGVLSEYGMTSNGLHYVCDANPGYYLTSDAGYSHAMFYTHIENAHAATGNFADNFVVSNAHAIELTPTEGVKHTPWLYTSEAGYLMKRTDASSTTYTADETRTTYTVGAIAEAGDTRIVWLSSTFALASNHNTYSDNNGNFRLAISAMKYMTGIENDGITIEPISISQETINFNAAQFTVIAVILVGILPLSVAAAGIVIWSIRKRR